MNRKMLKTIEGKKKLEKRLEEIRRELRRVKDIERRNELSIEISKIMEGLRRRNLTLIELNKKAERRAKIHAISSKYSGEVNPDPLFDKLLKEDEQKRRQKYIDSKKRANLRKRRR